MPTIAITLNLSCCRCKSKIQKILCSIQERCELVFEKVVYEKDKVLVTGPFDAVDLCCKLRCKAGCFAGNIDIVPPPPVTQVPPTNKEPTKTQTTEQPKTKPVPCEKPIPIPYPYPCPYPYPYPYPQPCPSSCPTPPLPQRSCCECHSCKPPPPPPKQVCPEPPKPVCPHPPPPPPCPLPPVCGGGRCPTWPTPGRCRGYPPEFFCEDPDGACALM